MNASTIIFYILAASVIAGGLLAVTSRKIFRSAVFLLFSLIGIAGIYFFLDYEFIAAVQIVVYVGGIVVLLIFSIFLTHGSGEDMKRPHLGRAVFSSAGPAIAPTADNIGAQMLSTSNFGYILPFEVVSMLLLAAMIGCIVIAIKVKVPAHSILPELPEDEDVAIEELDKDGRMLEAELLEERQILN
jgi:NADH-quinone oxidoreductase subunit J